MNEKNCCCSWGAAVGNRGMGAGTGEYPEFGCARCEIHQGGLGETELCKHHTKVRNAEITSENYWNEAIFVPENDDGSIESILIAALPYLRKMIVSDIQVELLNERAISNNPMVMYGVGWASGMVLKESFCPECLQREGHKMDCERRPR